MSASSSSFQWGTTHGVCICERPLAVVLCRFCGYWNAGRVRRACPEHPNMVLLMDYELCPGCHSIEGLMETGCSAAAQSLLREGRTPTGATPPPPPFRTPSPGASSPSPPPQQQSYAQPMSPSSPPYSPPSSPPYSPPRRRRRVRFNRRPSFLGEPSAPMSD